MPPLLLLAALSDPVALVDAARRLTAAEQPCPVVRDSTDITVCGRRRADRFRVPFIVHDPGDPRYRSVREERQALLHRTTPIEDKSIFLVGGGMAGATVSVRGGDAGGTTIRPPAP